MEIKLKIVKNLPKRANYTNVLYKRNEQLYMFCKDLSDYEFKYNLLKGLGYNSDFVMFFVRDGE